MQTNLRLSGTRQLKVQMSDCQTIRSWLGRFRFDPSRVRVRSCARAREAVKWLAGAELHSFARGASWSSSRHRYHSSENA
jgi:hypothetical protein